MAITVLRGQSLSLLMEAFQEGEDGPPLDLTGATVTVHRKNFEGTPQVTVLDAAAGQFRVFLSEELTDSLPTTRVCWFVVKLDFGDESVVYPRVEIAAT